MKANKSPGPTLLFSLKWLIREWLWNKSLLGINLFLLLLAYSGVLLNLSYETSSQNFISERSRYILGGDLAASSASAPISEQDLKLIREKSSSFAESSSIEFLGNLRSGANASMASVSSVSDNYPLLGEIEIKDGRSFKWTNDNAIYLDEDLRKSLNIKLGDPVKLGEKTFSFEGEILNDPGAARGSSFFAPKAYIYYPAAALTGLTQFGSQVYYRYFFVLPAETNSIKVAEDLNLLDKTQAWSVRSADESIRQIKRTLDFVGKYLSWLTLLMILLGFITGFYLSQVHLRSAASRIALLIQLGLSPSKAQVIYGLQIFMEHFFAVAGAIFIISLANLLFITPALAQLPVEFSFEVTSQAILMTLALAILMSLLFLMPYLIRIPRIQLKSLLDQSAPFIPEGKGLRSWLPYALILIVFYGLSGVLLKDYRLSLVWLGFLLVTLPVPLFVLPYILRRLGPKLKSIDLKIPFLQLSRARFASSLLFISLCQILFVLTLLPQLEGAIKSELSQTSGERIPDFFAINMQEQDLDEIQSYFLKYSSGLTSLSPMILGRLSLVNGTPPLNESFSTRPLRLSYRSNNFNSETVTEGLSHLPIYSEDQDYAYLSIEEEYASRNDLKLDDILSFTIGGLEVEGQIRQIRSIDWQSFEPNFFMQFQDGFLNDFPKTWIGVVYDIEPDKKLEVLNSVLDKFSSMTVIDLSETIEKLSEITQTLAPPVEAAAQLQAFLTLIILFLLIVYHQNSRSKEFVLFQLLGASPARVRLMMIVENLLLCLCAAFISMTAAVGFSYWLIKEIFEASYSPQGGKPGAYLIISLLIITIVTWVTTARVQNKKGQEISLLAS